MSRYLSIIFGLIITLSVSLTASPAMAATGLSDGHLQPCPESPNCVVSQDGDEKHSVEPITYSGDRNEVKSALLKVLSVVPRTEVVEDTGDYIRTESTSRLFKFVDDAEFYFPEDENVIQVRSASRVGESDLGVNRRRIEQIRLALADLLGSN